MSWGSGWEGGGGGAVFELFWKCYMLDKPIRGSRSNWRVCMLPRVRRVVPAGRLGAHEQETGARIGLPRAVLVSEVQQHPGTYCLC